MFVHPDCRINRFKDIKIPSSQELLKLYSFKDPIGHNDMDNSLPDNINGVDNLDKVNITANTLNNLSASELKTHESDVSQNMKSDNEEAESK